MVKTKKLHINKNKDITKLVLLLFFIVYITVVEIDLIKAEVETLGTFKKNDCVRLLQSCANCTYNNITSINYPNGSVALYQIIMTKIGTEYNYTFCDTIQLGEYVVNGKGDVDGELTVWSYNFIITSTGEQVSLSNIIIVIAFLFISGLLFILGYTFDKSKYIIKSTIYLFSLIMLLVALNSGRIIASESIGLSSMSEGALILMIAFVLIFFLYVFITWMTRTFKLFNEKKDMRWEY